MSDEKEKRIPYPIQFSYDIFFNKDTKNTPVLLFIIPEKKEVNHFILCDTYGNMQCSLNCTSMMLSKRFKLKPKLILN